MTARAIGSGTVSFGLVNIPVKLYSASESNGRISFNQLHKKCKGRLKQQLYCPTDNETVSREDIVKGYEFAKDQYVIFTEEELDALEQESTKAIEISEFIPVQSIDPLYFDTGYYLGPDKGAERAFQLLARALKECGQAAVARHTTRGKQHLVLIRPVADGLVMQQLRYADEVRAASEVPLGQAELKEPELALAKQFIQQMSVDRFQPEKYQDEHKRRVQEIIERKVKGEAVSFAPPSAPPAQVVDLMEALKASLAKAGTKQADTPPAPPPLTPREEASEKARKPPKRAPAREAPAAKPKAKGSRR